MATVLRVLWLDPFHGGSHAAVSQGYQQASRHQVTLKTLSTAGGWRWRMRGAAVSFARQLFDATGGASLMNQYDLLVTTDMLDLATFLGLVREMALGLPVIVYFHENQLTYPLPTGRERDLSFAWMNYTTALVADALVFNSAFHRQVFLEALPGLITRFHDYHEADLLPQIAEKSLVLPPGIDLQRLHGPDLRDSGPPVILWNSRWEYDKQPALFFQALEQLAACGVPFRLIVAGQPIDPLDPLFEQAKQRFADRIIGWGYAEPEQYAAWLRQADLVVSTAIQEFFGIGVVEAMAAGAVPLLPRRLSYPELLPTAFHDHCLYADDLPLVDALARSLSQLDKLRQPTLRHHVAQYDWSQLGSQYDLLFGRIAVPL